MQRGEIYEVDLGSGRGRELAGTQYAVVLSSAATIAIGWTIVVMPAADASRSATKYGIIVTAAETGLQLSLRFLPTQLRAIDSSRFASQPMGRVPDIRLPEFNAHLKWELDIP